MTFFVGMTPWNKGKKLSEEHKRKVGLKSIGRIPPNKGTAIKIEKICLTCSKHFVVGSGGKNRKYCCLECRPSPMKGTKMSKETKLKISINRTGKGTKEKNGAWKGGITSENRLARVAFRRTMQKLVFDRDNYTCQICGQRGGKLQVDHIQPWSDNKELRFDINTCRTLCMACHYKITFGRELPEDATTWGHNLLRKAG